ncbi:MAG: B12-binding domain-containing protein [Polyangiaceae bacterium]|nr:B12-binding domain-containing protein [Polyangiaceae bacterium]
MDRCALVSSRTFLASGERMVDLSSLRSTVLDGDARTAVAEASAAPAAGASQLELVERAIGPAMDEVGRLFDEGECFVPHHDDAGDGPGREGARGGGPPRAGAGDGRRCARDAGVRGVHRRGCIRAERLRGG